MPGTDFNSAQVAAITAMKAPLPGVRATARLWGNRALVAYPLKANPLAGPPVWRSDGAEARIEYSSYAKADAATLAEISWHIGNRPHQPDHQGYLDVLNAAGFADGDWIDYHTARLQADALFTGAPRWGGNVRVITDRVVAPDARLIDAVPQLRGGITLDWEVTDRRQGDDATRLILRAAALLHARGMQLILETNALNASVAGCGLNQSNLWLVHAAVDFMNITITPTSKEHDAIASIRNQLALLTGPGGDKPINYSKLALNVNIGSEGSELSPNDAATARQAVLGTLPNVPRAVGKRQFGAVRFSNGFGRPGGDPRRPYNMVISTVLGLPAGTYLP